jgi:ATP-dependent DNA helicase RecG
MESTKELIEKLNLSDEFTTIEAKKATNIHRSVLESVCAFANEPGLGGGNILLGVECEENSLFQSYVVCGVENTDKLQLDLSTQCAAMFNHPIRPEITVDNIGGKNVLNVFVPELHQSQKPVYFKADGLPRGAYRRIGSSDQRCTDDDLFVFYNKEDSLDSSTITDTSFNDISEEAVQLYRNLRSKVNPYAEELQYPDSELLQSLGCCKRDSDRWHLTYAGLLVFGKRQSHRRILPMVRVDYIRVPGNEWIADPENRFTTIDMRGSLIELVQRTFSAIADDLPKGFLLPEGEIQADSVGLPSRVLREAIVNAFIHRSYRENQPIQIIRYSNRLEIKNPGFSLKPEDQLGEPGSRNRNPFIAAIFHETNLAETKGSGIRTMRTLMEKAELMPPTFESDHGNNVFTIRLLLHHFLNEEDLKWLNSFNDYDLSDSQKRALIFLREVGAIDNATHRQLNGFEILKASSELRGLRDKDLILQKGKGRSTYYIPNLEKHEWGGKFAGTPVQVVSAPVQDYSEPVVDYSEPALKLSEPVRMDLVNQFSLLTKPVGDFTEPVGKPLPNQLPDYLQQKLNRIGQRNNNKEDMKQLVLELCSWKNCSLSELAKIINRNEKHLLYNYVTPLKNEGKLEYTHPEMPNHPQQAYKTAHHE